MQLYSSVCVWHACLCVLTLNLCVTVSLTHYTLPLSNCRYFGNQKSMLIPNCLFRVGGAAMLLSNKRTESW